jgi:adenylate cyclase class IV
MSIEEKTNSIASEGKAEEVKANPFHEVELKFNADDIDIFAFKDLAKSFNPKSFIYVESQDIYYAKSENEFLRHRLPAQNKGTPEESRSELTLKRKTVDQNNWKRIEINLRVDGNDPKLVEAFCAGLNFTRNFAIEKCCQIYFYETVDIVMYSVKDENGSYSHFLEIEGLEDIGMTPEQLWEEVIKYEKLLAPLGITPQKRKKLSLWEIYRKGF